jgi:hypothetical protein
MNEKRKKIYQEIEELRIIQETKLGYDAAWDDGYTVEHWEELITNFLTENTNNETRFLRAASLCVAALEAFERKGI